MIAGGLRIACGLLLCGEAAVAAIGGHTLGLASAALFLTGRVAVRQDD
jgi:hypothetical protein